MNNQWFHDILNDGLQTFADYWGFGDIEKRWKENGSIGGGEYEFKRRINGLKKSLEWDASGLTTYMLLRAYLHDLLNSTSYTAFELMHNWETLKDQFSELNRMRLDLEKPEALALLADYEKQLKRMAKHYKTKNYKGFVEVISDPVSLAFLRMSAFTSLKEKLKAHQFLQGEGTENKLKIHANIFEFWNINSLIRSAAYQTFDGVSLCLIRSPEKDFFASFFAFAIKAGETLTILTDRDRDNNPNYRYSSRRRDRDLGRRMDENWFPYQLLDYEIVETESDAYLVEANRDQIVPYQKESVIIEKLGKCEPEQIVWLGILLELIADEYGGKTPRQLESLSYTGEMVRKPHALVPASSSLITQEKYRTLEVKKFKNKKIDAAATRDNFEKPSYGHNRHIWERFKDQVPDDALNLIGDDEIKLLKEKHDGLIEKVDTDRFSLNRSGETRLFSLHPQEFGTPAELEKDREYFARYNQVSICDTLAHREFEEKKDEICDWYKARVEENLERLIDFAAAMRCDVAVQTWKTASRKSDVGDGFLFKDERITETRNILKIGKIPTSADGDYWYHHWFFGGYSGGNVRLHEYDKSKCLCISDNATQASIAVLFKPVQAFHLALLAGVSRKDLPEQLKCWNKEKPYIGNSILDRLDPEDFALHDYFRDKLDFEIRFTLSKSYFNRLRKERGLSFVPFNNLTNS